MADIRQHLATVFTNAAGEQQGTDGSIAEYIVVTSLLTASGDNTIYTPTVGKSVRLHWVYAINSPATATPAVITISLGGVVKYITYGVSRKQQDTGPVNGSLVINLSQAAAVACTFRVEEV